MPSVLKKKKIRKQHKHGINHLEQMRHSVSLPNTEILPRSCSNVTVYYFLKQRIKGPEMSQELKALTAPAEDLGSVRRTHMEAHNCSSTYKGRGAAC